MVNSRLCCLSGTLLAGWSTIIDLDDPKIICLDDIVKEFRQQIDSWLQALSDSLPGTHEKLYPISLNWKKQRETLHIHNVEDIAEFYIRPDDIIWICAYDKF
jgi:hypothetical protein